MILLLLGADKTMFRKPRASGDDPTCSDEIAAVCG